MDIVSDNEAGSAVGTSTPSTEQQKSDAPTGAPPASAPPEEGGKKKARNPMAELLARAARSLKDADGLLGDSAVQGAHQLAKADLATFEKVLGLPAQGLSERLDRGAVRTQRHKVLARAHRSLVRCITITAAGKSLVADANASTVPARARNLLKVMTPAVLQHNQPLLDGLESALKSFEAADAEYRSDQATEVEDKHRLKVASSRLRLALTALDQTTRAAKNLARREKFVAQAAKSARGRKHA